MIESLAKVSKSMTAEVIEKIKPMEKKIKESNKIFLMMSYQKQVRIGNG